MSHRKSGIAVLSSICEGQLRVTAAPCVMAAALLLSGAHFAKAQAPASQRRSDIQRTLPITKFYDAPDPLPPGEPGELIRKQEFWQYELPYSVSAVRILYHSRSPAGEDVAASGVVLIPGDGKPPAEGWPIIAWAHGATGVGRACAPSLLRNIGHGAFLAMYANLGYAVVAIDYTGLGTKFRNAFLDGPSNATDVVNAVSAARAGLPQLGAKWVVMGEAEGGQTAVAVAEKENELRDPGYLGAIAISGIASPMEISEHSGLMLASLTYGVKTVYPQFQVTEMLTEKGLALYRNIDQMCSQAALTELSPAQTVKSGWKNDPFVRRYFGRNDLGQKRAYGPILVVSSADDQSTLATSTAQAVGSMCKVGDRVQWQRYNDLDPDRVIGDSVRDQIGWIEGRLAGRVPKTNCP